MKKFKEIFLKLLFLPGWLMLMLTVFSAMSLVTVFLKGWTQTAFAYAVYPISAYALTAVVLFFVNALPKRVKSVKQRVLDNPLGNRYITDMNFKLLVSLYLSLGVNLAYSAFKLVTGIYYSSMLFISIAVYYIILSVIRFLILRYMRLSESGIDLISEYKRCRLCGILMLVLNIALNSMIGYIIFSGSKRVYPEVIIITSACYTFYRVTVSVIDIVKYRKHERPVVRTAKAIRLAAALVSLLSLESSMIMTFGESELFFKTATSVTGAAICAIIAAISVYIIASSGVNIKRIKSGADVFR